MCDLSRLTELLRRLDNDEEVTSAARERLEVCRNELQETERRFEESKVDLAEEARRAYERERARLECEVGAFAKRRAVLRRQAKFLRAKVQDLRERGDIEAARRYRVKLQRCCDDVCLLEESYEEARRNLMYIRPPRSNYERWLSADDEVMRTHEYLRGELKKARCRNAEAARDCLIAEAIEAATREVLALELETTIGAEAPRETGDVEAVIVVEWELADK